MSDPRERLANRPQRTGKIGPFAWDPADADRIEELRNEMATAQAQAEQHPKSPTSAKAASKAAKAYRAALADVVTVTFEVHAIGPTPLQELMAEHPPTDEQLEAERASAVANGHDPDSVHLPFNDKTFPPALLAQSCDRVVFSDSDETIDGLTSGEALTLWAGLPQGDQMAVHLKLMSMNQRGTLVEALGKD